MTYSGATPAAESRKMLSTALEALQQEKNIPEDVLSVAQNIAQAVSALFEAEHASSDLDGRASVRHAMGSLSQTLALLQDVRSTHQGIEVATQTLAKVMSKLYPLAQATSIRPSAATDMSSASAQQVIPKPSKSPSDASTQARPVAGGPRQQLEANVGATTESNFFVGFSGEISEGGVFVATYMTLPIGTPISLLVTLPGGYEATIPGKVLFVRDPMDMDSEPGIGVQFESITPENRELVLRFIRKRAPLFFDF